ncbi:MAG: HAD family hydrolase [Saprospiraceae bacterium]
MQIDLSKYDHVMLDMNGTFIFDFDNFDESQNFGATYIKAGYTNLTEQESQRYVRQAYDHMIVRYVDEAYYHRFPSVRQAIEATAQEALSSEVVEELVDTFALHELGILPDAHKRTLDQLAEKHPLSVLSNLWAPKQRWLDKMPSWGINQHFSDLHFSSDGNEMKPHSAFFNRALTDLQLSPKQVLYVGDSYRCDVLGAIGAGVDVVWLAGDKPAVAHRKGHIATCVDLPDFASRATY